MQAAFYVPLTIVAIGLFLILAAALAFTATWIALGLLAIAMAGAIGIVVASAPTASRRASAAG